MIHDYRRRRRGDVSDGVPASSSSLCMCGASCMTCTCQNTFHSLLTSAQQAACVSTGGQRVLEQTEVSACVSLAK